MCLWCEGKLLQLKNMPGVVDAGKVGGTRELDGTIGRSYAGIALNRIGNGFGCWLPLSDEKQRQSECGDFSMLKRLRALPCLFRNELFSRGQGTGLAC